MYDYSTIPQREYHYFSTIMHFLYPKKMLTK
ncbi:hypothetical protein Premu_2656 [Hallella multisaccharivorax DSM 17128]|uniref:Uncharacterized protein n=1 Tax=Hallella multisaccharivorax DSM 17128 TaxID=688246 RepID=F8NBP8_9BACT|nr:hypothetical protein Premu_2656 [Hallella multisaccharivorax DSM 17128]